jgi:hypothetical protein
MSLEGSIKDFGLSDIFQLIYVQQKSGSMTVNHHSRKATVGFVKGMVVSAKADEAEGVERIGDVLVRAKRITPRQLEIALKLQQERSEYLGDVLVSEGILSPEDLKRALKLQTLETVYGLFRWKDGRYTFDQEPVSYPKEFVDPISTEHILMEGIRRLDEWPFIEKKIPSLDMVFAQVPGKETEIEQTAEPMPPATVSDDPLADLDSEPQGRFSTEEITVYRAVNGTHSVSRIIELVQLGEFEVCKGLANLLTAGLVVPVGGEFVAHEGAEERRAGLARILAGLGAAAQWTVNILLIGGLLAGAVSWGADTRDWLVSRVGADLRSVQTVLLPHHVKVLQELVGVWRAERGSAPTSIFEPISVYNASAWPLSDPWGKPWTYNPNADTISAGTDPVSSDNNFTE